jgi:D-alanine-D-alanine ligase
MDKDIAKRLFRAAGVPTPDWHLWPCTEAEIADLGLPLIVKPSKVGSTVGLTLVADASGVPDAVGIASKFDDEILLERFVDGIELTVGVLGDRALGVGEIRPAHDIFDYECKYTPGMCEEVFPAQLDPVVTARAQELALKTHQALKLRDYSRIDFRAGPDETLYCLEANTLPGLTPTSLLPQSAAAAGIPFGELCDHIVRTARDRHNVRNNVSGVGMKN